MGDCGCGACWNMYIKSTNQVIKKPFLCFEFKLLWATPGYLLYSFFCVAFSVANDSSSDSWFQWRVYRHDQCGNRSSSLQPIAGYVKTTIMQNTEKFVVWIDAVTELILYDLLELYSWVKFGLLQDKKGHVMKIFLFCTNLLPLLGELLFGKNLFCEIFIPDFFVSLSLCLMYPDE